MNTIQTENSLSGTTAWHLANPATAREIEGYCSATSVNAGGSIDFHISSSEANYTIAVYRMGWYGGAGGRLMTTVSKTNGSVQAMPTADATTNRVACAWTAKHTLAVPSDWVSGIYLTKLTQATSGKDCYLIFCVREDARAAQILYQQPVTTYHAYNCWGGKSLYPFNSAGTSGNPLYGITFDRTGAAYKVSFDRPYGLTFPNRTNNAFGIGAGDFVTMQNNDVYNVAGWELDTVQWLEQNGYDVKYQTDVDTHNNPTALLAQQIVLSAGHDEYWSMAMRDAWVNARAAGVHLVVMGANAAYWQIRFEDGTRTIVAYKDQVDLAPDPEPDPTLKTKTWLDLGKPEGAWMGVQYSGYFNTGFISRSQVATPADPMWAGTGVTDGQSILGIGGYEYDAFYAGAGAPTGVRTLMHHDMNGSGSMHDATIHQAPSGAWVFATGTLNFPWGLNANGYLVPSTRSDYTSPAIQGLMTNVLTQMDASPGESAGGGPSGPGPLTYAPIVL